MTDPLTWPGVLALDDAALNTAIDRYVYGYVWSQVRGVREDWWECTEADGARTASSVPYFHHTASWERTMALSTRYKLDVRYDLFDGDGRVGWFIECAMALIFVEDDRDNGMPSPVEHAIRVARCRIALWEALSLKEESALERNKEAPHVA